MILKKQILKPKLKIPHFSVNKKTNLEKTEIKLKTKSGIIPLLFSPLLITSKNIAFKECQDSASLISPTIEDIHQTESQLDNKIYKFNEQSQKINDLENQLNQFKINSFSIKVNKSEQGKLEIHLQKALQKGDELSQTTTELNKLKQLADTMEAMSGYFKVNH